MVSMYHGIETGKSAMAYFKKSMEVAGINTSKAKEAGYSRQTVTNAAKPALSTGKGYSMLGTGVEMTAIVRMRDQYLDERLRRSTVEASYYETMVNGMSRVDKIVQGNNDNSLSNMLDNFWTAIQDVHKYPDDAPVRLAFLNESDSLVDFTKTLSNNYATYRTELNDDIRSMVEEANSLIDQIAVINRGIRDLLNIGAEPNALLDKRDLLLDRLSALTGAKAGVSELDQADGDFKVDIDGRTIIQGTSKRHLVLVENEFNNGFYGVQIEYNQYDESSNTDAVGVIIEQRADDHRCSNGTCTMDAFHTIEVVRTADEMYWQVGHAKSDIEGGQRISSASVPGGLLPTTALGINGTFALSVGSTGVRAYSEVFDDDPPGIGIILGEHKLDEPTEYSFRIAAGGFENTISIKWDAAHVPNAAWVLSDSSGDATHTSAHEELTVDDLAEFINKYCSDGAVFASNDEGALVLENASRQLMSITDISGSLMTDAGLTDSDPIVKIDVEDGDSLQTIANKINNAYMFDRIVQIEGEGDDKEEKRLLFYETIPADTAPSAPEQWMHATVEKDESGEYYLLLTSNIAGEENRINVMSGSVCGEGVNDMTVARLLGLVEDGVEGEHVGDIYKGHKDMTSYVQVDKSTGAVTDRYTKHGDVFVDDAYVILDGKKEFLSAGNAFNDARHIAEVGNAEVEELSEFSAGIRVFANGVGKSDIIVRHELISGAIYSAIKLRDDVLLSHTDVFDDMMYKLTTQFNAIHYAGYGSGAYKEVSGLGFFDEIDTVYGAFGKLAIDSGIVADDGTMDESRLAAMSGDGNGHNIGSGDGNNALAIAQIKQMKLFMGGMCDFNDMYRDFVAEYSSFSQHNKTLLANQTHITEQVQNERSQIMDVNIDEEMATLVEMNQQFNYTSRYLSTLISVMDSIISGLGRVGL